MATRQQRELLNPRKFITRIETNLRNLNNRFGTNLVFDDGRGLKAHSVSIAELEILLDSNNESDLFEAFDIFLDILAERLIASQAFSHLISQPDRPRSDAATIQGLLQTFGNILAPLMILEDWLRAIVFNMTAIKIPSLIEDANAATIHELCLSIQRNSYEARRWREAVGYPPLDIN